MTTEQDRSKQTSHAVQIPDFDRLDAYAVEVLADKQQQRADDLEGFLDTVRLYPPEDAKLARIHARTVKDMALIVQAVRETAEIYRTIAANKRKDAQACV